MKAVRTGSQLSASKFARAALSCCSDLLQQAERFSFQGAENSFRTGGIELLSGVDAACFDAALFDNDTSVSIVTRMDAIVILFRDVWTFQDIAETLLDVNVPLLLVGFPAAQLRRIPSKAAFTVCRHEV